MYKTVLFLFVGSWVTISSFHVDKSFLNGKAILLSVYKETNCSAQFSCLDCKTARICKPDGLGKFQQVMTIPCPSEKPYCTNQTGTCSDQPDDSCRTSDASFVCMDDGHFPGINCTDYHVCIGLQAYKFHCAIKGENFDAQTNKCDKNNFCGTYTKCAMAGVKVAHEIYPQYFGYCSSPGSPAVIDKCKGANELNETSQRCEPICHKVGVLEDPRNCTEYYKCQELEFPNGNGELVKVMVKDHLRCPENTAFVPDQSMCIDIRETKCNPRQV